MEDSEIERIKGAVARALGNVKGPANQIIKDLEASILTVESLKLQVTEYRKHMERAIEYLNLSLLESFGGLSFESEERWKSVSEALRLLHHGLGKATEKKAGDR